MTPVPPSPEDTFATVPTTRSSRVIEGPLQPGAPFGARYRILRLLGAGGMGVVYQAWDDELGVAVALKVIRPEVTADPYAARDVERRFKRELLLARQVTHKHVVRIHDLGEVDGIKYLTMPFVEGRDLASILREGAVAIPRVVRFAKQLADGLQAAHDAGVVHRDLKPENIMIDAEDQALIMDFGISRSATAGGATMTAQGVVVGTLEYMAPEQGRGMQVDHRADIYAFGLILYDMIVGRHRLERHESAIVEMMARMQQPPAPLKTLVPQVPDALAAIVARCIEPDVAKRFATTADLVQALQRLDAEGRPIKPPAKVGPWRVVAIAAAVVVLVLAAAIGLVLRSARSGPPSAAREPVSVLIADFQNTTGDSVFQDSLEQALGIAIEGAPFISAYPRPDAQRTIARLQPGARLDEAGARIVAAREGVGVILAGSIAQSGNGYVLTIKGIDPHSERPLFLRDKTVASKADVLTALGSIASAIRKDLGDTADAEHRAADAETFTAGSIEAMRAYARGEELNRSGKPRDALAALEEAVRLDPGFGMAYVHIASIYTNFKMDEKAMANYEEAFKHLDRMTEREKYRSLGVYQFGVVRNYKEAIKTYQKLVELYPADNTGYANLALAQLYDRNIPQAVAMGRKAIEIYPRNILQRTNYATYCMYSGDFKTAIAEASRVLTENPSYEWANLTLALSTLAQGDEAGARDAYARLARISPLGASLANMGLADLEMYFGRYRKALDVLKDGIALDERERNANNLALKLIAAAEAHFALGERGEALAAADRSTRSSQHEAVLVPAAHLLIELGREDRAREIAYVMQQMLPPHIRSYAHAINGDLALHRGRLPEALDELHAAEGLHDSWFVHLLLGRVYEAARQFPEAERERELSVGRRGEAADVFFADTSSLRYLPPVYYWLARSQDVLGAKPAAADNFRKYLQLRAAADNDPLAADARQRLPH